MSSSRSQSYAQEKATADIEEMFDAVEEEEDEFTSFATPFVGKSKIQGWKAIKEKKNL